VQAALEELPGVAEVQVSFANRSCTISFDPERTSTPKMLEVIETTGFKAHEVPQ